MDREEFSRQVQTALVHLHNRAYLEACSLATAFRTGDKRLSGDALRHVLIDAIEQLKPAQASPTAVTDWRRYRHLVLRHHEGWSISQIMRELAVSNRQASRDYQQGVETLIALLWVRRSVSPPAPPGEPADWSGPRASLPDAEPDRPLASEADVSLVEVVGGVVTTLHALLPDRGITVDVSVPDTLPPIAVDKAILRQSLLQLLTYVLEVAPSKRVTIAGADDAAGVVLRTRSAAVSDAMRDRTAWGGEATDLNSLFQSGRGLLAEYGAKVELTAVAGEPLEMTLVLPPVQHWKVLVVDDNPDVVGLFRRYLRGRPYRLIQATTGTSALHLALDLHPDVVVLDVLLPFEDGWDTLRHLRETPPLAGTPVIVSSVLPERALAHSLQVADFLPKPVTRSALIAALERCCSAPVRRPDPPEPSA